MCVVPNKPQADITPNDHKRFATWSVGMPPHILAMAAKLADGVSSSKLRQVPRRSAKWAIDAVVQGCVFLGESGSGKSRALMVMVS